MLCGILLTFLSLKSEIRQKDCCAEKSKALVKKTCFKMCISYYISGKILILSHYFLIVIESFICANKQKYSEITNAIVTAKHNEHLANRQIWKYSNAGPGRQFSFTISYSFRPDLAGRFCMVSILCCTSHNHSQVSRIFFASQRITCTSCLALICQKSENKPSKITFFRLLQTHVCSEYC